MTEKNNVGRSSLLKIITVNVIIFFVLFFLLEVFARFVFYQGRDDYLFYGWAPIGKYGNLSPNAKGVFNIPNNPHRAYWIQTNEFGLRNVAPVDDTRRKIRILALGDSFTFGVNLSNYDTWPYRLQQELDRRFEKEGVRFEVLNAGVAGYTIEDHLSYLNDKGFDLQPDMVIIATTYTDIADYRDYQRELYRRSTKTHRYTPKKQGEETLLLSDRLSRSLALKRLIDAIQLKYKLWYNGITRRDSEAKEEGEKIAELRSKDISPDKILYKSDYTTRKYWDAYLGSFIQIAKECQSKNIPLQVVAIPDPRQLPEDKGYPPTYQNFLKKTLPSFNIHYADLLPLFRSRGQIDSLYFIIYDTEKLESTWWPENPKWKGDPHTSAYGNFIVAKGISEYIETNKSLNKYIFETFKNGSRRKSD